MAKYEKQTNFQFRRTYLSIEGNMSIGLMYDVMGGARKRASTVYNRIWITADDALALKHNIDLFLENEKQKELEWLKRWRERK